MRFRFLSIVGALAFGLVSAGAAAAAPITYTFSGEASGTVGGVAFTEQAYSFSLLGDTTTTTAGGSINVVSSATVTIAGTACAAGCALTAPNLYDIRSDFGEVSVGVIGIGVIGSAAAVNEAFFPTTAPFIDLALPFAPLVADATNAVAPYSAVDTSGGPVQIITNTNNPTFSISLAAAPVAVPTLSEWATILLGLLLAGGAAVLVQRRRSLA